MTYKFNPQQHSTKIKAALAKAKKNGKKLGRPKGGKIKHEGLVIMYLVQPDMLLFDPPKAGKPTLAAIAKMAGVSISTVQKIINKYKKENG